MRMDVSLALKNPGHEFPFALELPLRDQEFAGEAIEFKSDARLEGTYAMQGAGVVVRGELSVKLSRQCSKCLGPVDTAVECEFEDMFFKEPDPDEPNDLFIIENYTIDMSAYAESLVFLELPMTAQCSPDCKGLCPVCGANLNISQCSCGKADTPSDTRKPFAALEDLLTRDEEV
ncbi:MAG TPA: DUF177 domain-containing protein [Candidatus Fimadaptatus faecigallinarum]|uniref:DUF177 domain-containing protein n=1 Tax=Candidatus Fimadaptatus faecigallinarum TaxID=2840814 RepID=A0A9D1LQ61_9FIRM|nr:DUF177 domain-containing protein [Candidatus Fimadaptatus faecigallinarum]